MALNFNKSGLLTPQVSELEVVTKKYNDYRKNLLFLVGFTVVNIILAVAGADFYMLFSASVPYYSVFLALLFADKLPADYYLNYETGNPEYFEIPGAEIFLVVAAAIAAVTLGVYVLMWVLSKKELYSADRGDGDVCF